MQTINMTIHLGFCLREENVELPIEKARDILLSRKQKDNSSATRKEFTATLKRHYIQCPYCNHRTYAYAKELNRDFKCRYWRDYRLRNDVIEEWTSQQMTIFDGERAPLQLSRVITPSRELVCPKCRNTIRPSSKTRQVELTRKRHKVFIRTEVADLRELFALPCVSGLSLRVEFPIYEVACFNFRNGHTYVRLENADGQCLAVRDLTGDKYAWGTGAVYVVLNKSKYVRRHLRDLFRAEWKGELPFVPSELGVKELRLLTAYIGYNRNFYSSIPFAENSLKVEPDFAHTARRLHHTDGAIALFEGSLLPKIPSIKRIFYDNPALFFYLDECEKLYCILKDHNYLRSVLEDENVYTLLSSLHMRPGIFDFLADYAALGRIRNLLDMIHDYWYSLCAYAANYCSMSPAMQKREQEKWKKHKRGTPICRMPSFGIPLTLPHEHIRNCLIDEFEFAWLTSSTDYAEAGKALSNCLTEWNSSNFPVVCVRKNGEIIAAIEVRGDYVFQAYTSHNQGLKKIPGLTEAYYRWYCKNNMTDRYVPGIQRFSCCEELETPEDLPF